VAAVAQTSAGDTDFITSNSAASLAVPKPTNTANGDVLWVVCYFRNSSANLTAPAGWTWAQRDGSNGTLGFAVKAVSNAGTEPSTYTFSTDGGANRCVAMIGRITGADTSNPVDAVGAASATTGTTSLVHPAVTAVNTGTLLLTASMSNTATGTASGFTRDPAMTQVTQHNVNTGSNTSNLQVAQQALTSSGSTGTRTATMSPAAQNSLGFMVTIKAGTRSGTGTITGSALLTASGKKATSGTATITGTAAVTSSGKKVASGTGSIAAVASLGGSGYTGAASWGIAIDWANDGTFTGVGDDVTSRALEASGLSMTYGRDQVRELSPMVAGSADLGLDNTSRDYSPDNLASPLAGNVLPARPVRVTAFDVGTTYTLFQGFTDDYSIDPAPPVPTVAITALDAVAKLKGAQVTTELYSGIRTGTAIGYVLDALGWPAELRDLDPGATTVRWWWAEDEDAFDAVQKLVQSEGPPAMLTSDEQGRIVFRDRHHRLLTAAATTSQQTFTDESSGEPSFTAMAYDHGWSNIVNSVSVKVEELDPADTSTLWQSESNVSIGTNATLTLNLTLDSPAIRPQVSYTVLSGTVTDSLTVDSGQTLTLELTAGTGGALVTDLQVTGQAVTSQRSYTILLEDQASIDENGKRSLSYEVPWAGFNDAAAVAQLILDASAQRRPIVTLTLVSGTEVASTRLTEQFSRDLSDRVHVREPVTCVDHDFHIEQITHNVQQAGLVLETKFGMEQAVTQAENAFRFNDSAHGFDDGVFASVGLADPEHLFVFDTSGHGFDDGVFAT
jgi:hypothetical protein